MCKIIFLFLPITMIHVGGVSLACKVKSIALVLWKLEEIGPKKIGS